MPVIAWLGVFTGAGYLLVELGGERMARDTYAQRLHALSDNYESLRLDYNRAIARTAITALRVEADQVTVEIRRADGTLSQVPTPFSPNTELYVDYLVQEGRLLIRRVFDSNTPPGEALVIDDSLLGIDWSKQPQAYHGKAVYRSLTEGRWVITVSGNGALGLEKIDAEDAPYLTAAPQLETFAELDASQGDPTDITLKEMAVYWWDRATK